MKRLMLMSQRSSSYDNKMLLYCVARLGWPLDFRGQGDGCELLAFYLWLPSQS